jgi:hypothetical protein
MSLVAAGWYCFKDDFLLETEEAASAHAVEISEPSKDIRRLLERTASSDKENAWLEDSDPERLRAKWDSINRQRWLPYS